MKTIPVGKDVNGILIKKGDRVAASDGLRGPITEIYNDGSVDIHYTNARQGPVIGSFDIIGDDITKI